MAAGSRQKGSQLNQLKQSLKKTGLSRTNSNTSTFNPQNKTKSSLSSKIKDPEFRQKKLAVRRSTTAASISRQNITDPCSFVGNSCQSESLRFQVLQSQVSYRQPASEAQAGWEEQADQNRGEAKPLRHPSAPTTEKALERFTKERQLRSSRTRKRNVFNLDDGGEGLYDDQDFGDNVPLTHQGLHLNLDDDDDDNGRVGDPNEPESIFRKRLTGDSPPTGSDHGSQDDEEHSSKKKSKAEVMSEVIAKSKTHKYQRQMIKEKDDELRDNLNQDLKEIRSLLFSSQPHPSSHSRKKSLPALTTDNKSHDPPASETLPQSDTRAPESAEADQTIKNSSGPGVDRALLETLIGSSSRASSPESPDSPDDEEDAYDRFVRELAFDARAKPSDRLKTVEEAALEEAERLRHLEMQRLKRMRGDADDDDDDDDDGSTGKGKKTRKRKPEGDDLDDDFFPPEDSTNNTPWNLGKGLRPDGAFGAGALAEEEEEEEEDESGGQSDDSSASDANSGDDDGPLEPSIDKIQALVCSKTPSNKSGKSSKQELAYTYPCPSSHADFLSNLSAVDALDLPTVVERIRVLHHPSLGEGNKEKLAIFTQVLIDHLIYVTTQPVPPGISLSGVINGLLPHVISLCKAYTQAAAAHFVSKLVLMQNNLTRALTQPAISGWPRASELILLRLIGLLWSTSDFSHPVVAPALLLMNQYLHQLRVKTFTDLMSGLFLCTLILQWPAHLIFHSKRFVPEVINFLVLAVLRMTQTKEEITAIRSLVPLLEGAELVLFPMDEKTEQAPGTLDFGSLFTSSKEEPSSQDLVDTFDVVVSLLSNYSELYGSLGVYPEVFSEVLGVLSRVDTGTMGGWTSRRMREMRGLNPIKLQAHKPVPIKAQAPLFDAHFNPRQKPFNPDSNLVALQKLKHLVKKETKGAVRELRKDNRFLAMAQAAEKEAADLQYKSKVRVLIFQSSFICSLWLITPFWTHCACSLDGPYYRKSGLNKPTRPNEPNNLSLSLSSCCCVFFFLDVLCGPNPGIEMCLQILLGSPLCPPPCRPSAVCVCVHYHLILKRWTAVVPSSNQASCLVRPRGGTSQASAHLLSPQMLHCVARSFPRA
ncbi:hypothetical protein VP01_140g7 [Puccinia sorghi]|uniref:Nucleolar complex protein 14 n=1 Tax=Puccinia sorghi TaxID=27349 RepID=A0A0L6VL15_9BASI|nr:hypothetical protein VP01_140g7 [Puccinia sorghi]